MADRVFIVPGSPEFLFSGALLPGAMIDDLMEIAALDPRIVDSLAFALRQTTGFLNEDALDRLVKSFVDKESAAEAVVNALGQLRGSEVGTTLERVRKWRESKPATDERVSEKSLAALEKNLPKLIGEFPALRRAQKARRLGSLTGNQIRQIDFLCDVRPIFDSEQESVEGLLPQTTLRIAYESQTEEVECIELALSNDQLLSLLDKAEKAKHKMRILSTSIESWIPNGLAGEAVDEGPEIEMKE